MAEISIKLKLDEETIDFLEKKGYSIIALKKNGLPKPEPAKEPVQEPVKQEPEKPDMSIAAFDSNFNEFVRLRHGSFGLGDIRKWFMEHEFYFDYKRYAVLREQYKHKGYITVVNPSANKNARRFIKSEELNLTHIPEEQQQPPEPEQIQPPEGAADSDNILSGLLG